MSTTLEERGHDGLGDEAPAVDEDEDQDLDRRRDHRRGQHEHAHGEQDARDHEVDDQERQEEQEAIGIFISERMKAGTTTVRGRSLGSRFSAAAKVPPLRGPCPRRRRRRCSSISMTSSAPDSSAKSRISPARVFCTRKADMVPHARSGGLLDGDPPVVVWLPRLVVGSLPTGAITNIVGRAGR